MTTKPTPPVVKPAVQPVVQPAPKTVTVTPVFGPMHHPILNIRIEGETEVPEIDSWLKAQIDSGKLTVG